jgi:hypothetical protein
VLAHTTTTSAIIFIPQYHPLDGLLALACMGHLVRRGYSFVTVLRDWSEVTVHLAAGTAQVVILATRTHRAGEADRVEVVDEEHARMFRRRNAAIGRHAVPAAAVPGERGPRKIAVSGRREVRQSLYETARLLPRGDDGGFAERFLKRCRNRS